MTTPKNPKDTVDYQELQEIYLKWHDRHRPLSGFIKDIQAHQTQYINSVLDSLIGEIPYCEQSLKEAKATIQQKLLMERVAELELAKSLSRAVASVEGRRSWLPVEKYLKARIAELQKQIKGDK